MQDSSKRGCVWAQRCGRMLPKGPVLPTRRPMPTRSLHLTDATSLMFARLLPPPSTSSLTSMQVLRKQPPGTLLRGAHAVDREFRIMRALAGHVPVPTVRHLCEDRWVPVLLCCAPLQGTTPYCVPGQHICVQCSMCSYFVSIKQPFQGCAWYTLLPVRLRGGSVPQGRCCSLCALLLTLMAGVRCPRGCGVQPPCPCPVVQ